VSSGPGFLAALPLPQPGWGCVFMFGMCCLFCVVCGLWAQQLAAAVADGVCYGVLWRGGGSLCLCCCCCWLLLLLLLCMVWFDCKSGCIRLAASARPCTEWSCT